MIKFIMYKTYFHNRKSEIKGEKKTTKVITINKKSVVDINILLNKVKIEEKKQAKKKFFFFSFTTLALTLFGSFIAIIK